MYSKGKGLLCTKGDDGIDLSVYDVRDVIPRKCKRVFTKTQNVDKKPIQKK